MPRGMLRSRAGRSSSAKRTGTWSWNRNTTAECGLRNAEYAILSIPFLLRFGCSSFCIPHSELRTMKGPYERLKYDLRRVWECPVCKRRERTAFTVTFRHCNCQMKQVEGRPVVMKLVEDGVQRVTPSIMIQH